MLEKSYKYIFALVVCIIGFSIKLILIRLIHYPEGGFLLSLGMIMVSAWYGGFLPGLFAVFINYIIIDWLFITPGSLLLNDSVVDQVRFSFFLTEGVLISYLFESLHRANRKTKESLFNISRSEKLSRSLIENIKDYAIFLIDSKGLIISWNEGATLMTGYEKDEILEKPVSLLLHKFEKNPGLLRNVLKITKKGRQHHHEGWGIRKGDSQFWAETVITPLPSQSPREQTFSVIIHDLTTKKKVDDLKSEFLTIVAHELRTPASIMKLTLENIFADKSSKLRSNQNHELMDLNNEVNRLSLLIDDIVDIARLRTKKFSLSYKSFDLTSVTADVVRKMQLTIEEGRKLVFPPAKEIIVWADRTRIEQVLINLIDNAIKFTPKKGSISISLKKAKKKVTVSIFNETTELIPKDKYLLIFDKFYQLTKRPIKGFGLGLYISREIIKQHKGDIAINSQKGKGNTFSFTLPIK